MGLISWLENITKRLDDFTARLEQSQSTFSEKLVSQSVLSTRNTPVYTEWDMPKVRGKDICDVTYEISRLKGAGELSRAYDLALECMDAMIQNAAKCPDAVMDFYVSQPAIIIHKMGDYAEETRLLSDYLSLGLPAPREDHRLELYKRLAKAREMLAKQQGEDYISYRQEWQKYVQLEKEAKARHKLLEQKEPNIDLGGSFYPQHRPYPQYRTSSRTSKYIPTRKTFKETNFVAVDFETANDSRESACQISMVKFNDGRPEETYTTLIRPPKTCKHFKFTRIHGISADMVIDAPVWADIAADIRNFIGSLPVYAHNASFDRGVWEALDSYYGTNTLPDHFYCSMYISRRLLPELSNHKLPTVIEFCNPSFNLDHHEAESDATACGYIVAFLQRDKTLLKKLKN